MGRQLRANHSVFSLAFIHETLQYFRDTLRGVDAQATTALSC
ncbi:hypothetical protein [Streptomyces tubercidicus]